VKLLLQAPIWPSAIFVPLKPCLHAVPAPRFPSRSDEPSLRSGSRCTFRTRSNASSSRPIFWEDAPKGVIFTVHCSLFTVPLNLDCIFNETGARNRGIQGYGFHRSQLSSLSFSFNPVYPVNPFKGFFPCLSHCYPLLFYDEKIKQYQ